jgi:DNA polymerase I-like protein with 3'-5' exonuclease and polymerase domains
MNEPKALILNPPLQAVIINDENGFDLIDAFLKSLSHVGWDCETLPTKDYFWRYCRTFQFGNQNKQFVIDFLSLCNGDTNLLQNCQGYFGKNLNKAPKLKKLFDMLQPHLEGGKITWVGVNLSFEYMTSRWNFGLRPWKFFDCSLVERCIWAGDHSLKHYEFYDMENMMARYFGVQINKELQMSFNLTGPLTQEQIEYAALDTRLPLAIRAMQNIILSGKMTKQLDHLPKYLFGDDLREIAEIENNAIGAFVDMHINGEHIDKEKWTKNIDARKQDLKNTLDELDRHFLPIVGSKKETITQEQLDEAEKKWKSLNIVTDEEVNLRAQIRKEKDLTLKQLLREEQVRLEEGRKHQKELLKEKHYALRRKYSEIKKLSDKCEGEALINYDSGVQLIEALGQMNKTLAKLKDTGDDTLQEFSQFPVIKLIQKYRELSKEINTYGMAWTQTWTTHPCKEEGWLHPGDGKLHSQYNQYEAETGRSSSSHPNGQNIKTEKEIRSCFIVGPDEDGEEMVYVKADMSGAELRILAELSGEPVWIDAFNRGEDLHAVCTEIQYPDEWPTLALDDCAYFKLKEDGEPQRYKCNCPKHKELRDETKVPNFLIPYGGGPSNLATQLKKPLSRAKEILEKHRQSFPILWTYLEASGKSAKMLKKSFDMYGRRRLFPEPTWERALYKAKEDRKEKLLFDKKIADKNISDFIIETGRKPEGGLSDVDSEKWILTHRKPTDFEVGNAFKAMSGSIERAGKNHPIQSTNATIIKIAMATLWHRLPEYKAQLIKMVHDELLIKVPKRHGEEMGKLISQCIKEAAARKFKKLVMETDYNVEVYWKK